METNNIEMEIVRLVKEIASDEKEIIRAEQLELTFKAKRYRDSIERKLRLLEILKR